MLTDFQKTYQTENPDVPFHEVIDIIRGQADKEYLDIITDYCREDSPDQENLNPNSIKP